MRVMIFPRRRSQLLRVGRAVIYVRYKKDQRFLVDDSSPALLLEY